MSEAPSFSVREVFQRLPEDEACLAHLMEMRFGLRHTCRACGVQATLRTAVNAAVERLWHLFKHSMHGTHISVSNQWIGNYLREFTLRSNHRDLMNAMFNVIGDAA